jgi:dienelactone hydrolase
MKHAISVLAAVALLTAPALAQAPNAYDARGPYAVRQTQAAPGCHFFRPIKPEPKPSPVILWGNGTNVNFAVYSPMLVQWASHGFIVAAAMTGNAGSGKEMLACLDYLAEENERTGSVYKGAVDLSHVGAAGHSQGGRGAIMAGRDPRVTATAPIQPYTLGASYEAGSEAKQHGPMLLLSGGADNVADPARNQRPVFEKANVPVVWATLLAAGHSAPSTGDNGPYRAATTAWFLWQLAGDARAGAMFKGAQCGYCTNSAWSIEKRGVE